MRRSLRTVTLVVGTVAGTTSGAALLALGCGGDDSVSGVQEDGSSDSTVDVNPDSPLPDSAPTTEGGVDAGNGGDTGNRSDGDASSASDSTTITDSSDFADIGDVQIDVPSLAQFPLAVVSAFCGRLEQCCIMSQDIASPSQWNQNGDGGGCVPYLAANSGVFGVADHGAALSSGHVVLDASTASACLREFLSFQCGTIAATSVRLAKGDCLGAMVGTLSVDAGPCADSLECASNEFCRNGDSGTGTCVALGGLGQPCTDTANSLDCDYLGLGGSSLYCAPGDGGATCQNALPADAGCTTNNACQSGACVSPRCVSALAFSSTPTCRFFALPDAGDGG